MRLVCPNCDAEYEVEADLIPVEGRDVQCSNCSVTWFQKRDQDNDAGDAEPAAAPAGLSPQRPETDPAALDIIHEEVEREQRARQSEAAAIETQTDLGLDETETPASTARRTEPETQDPADTIAPAPKRNESTKKELFPDIEEINSTLADAPDPVHDESVEETPEAKENRRSSFRMGFGMMLMLTAALLALYVYAPSLTERFPAFEGALASYVSIVDNMRATLDAGAQGLLKIVDNLTEQVGS